MVYPTKSKEVNVGYGVPGNWAAGRHTGIDFEAHYIPIYATKGGTVVEATYYGSWGSDYGYHIVIQSPHEGGYRRHGYCHMYSMYVYAGQKVKAGQKIGISGNTGRSTGPHLHYEERVYPYGYYNHVRPELLYYQPDTRPVVHLSRLKPGKTNLDVRKLKRRMNRFFPNRRKLYGPRFSRPLRKRYAAYQRWLGYEGTNANGIPGRTSLEKLGFRVLD